MAVGKESIQRAVKLKNEGTDTKISVNKKLMKEDCVKKVDDEGAVMVGSELPTYLL